MALIIKAKQRSDIEINMRLLYNKQQIEIVKEYNYLGVEMDWRMSMENHINKCVKQANSKNCLWSISYDDL